jgi:hypothetical protein
MVLLYEHPAFVFFQCLPDRFLRGMARGVAKQDGIVAGRVGSPDAPQAASYQM